MQVGRYQLVRKLATGGMAEVYLAKATGPGGFEKTLVVKRILPHLAERASFLDMFFTEARVAAQLQHPNIVQIFDFGEADGTHFIAMEYVDGFNLRLLSKWAAANEPFRPALVARIGALVCEGLAFAHEFAHPETGEPLGLVHRDVSADNIMLSQHGAVKLLDFGVARVAGEDRGTSAGQMKGKVAYMPAEQVSGEPIDLRADIYALGVVLYVMLTGHRPFERVSDVALITAIISEEPTPLQVYRPDAPDELAAIIGRCLARTREERFDDCRQLQRALEAFIAHTGDVVGTAQLAHLAAKARAAGLGSAEPGRPSCSVSGSGSGSRSSATPRPPRDEPPKPSVPAPSLHLAGTVPGKPGPLVLQGDKTQPFLPTPEVLARLRAERAAAPEPVDAEDDELGPEPPTNPAANALLFRPAAHQGEEPAPDAAPTPPAHPETLGAPTPPPAPPPAELRPSGTRSSGQPADVVGPPAPPAAPRVGPSPAGAKRTTGALPPAPSAGVRAPPAQAPQPALQHPSSDSAPAGPSSSAPGAGGVPIAPAPSRPPSGSVPAAPAPSRPPTGTAPAAPAPPATGIAFRSSGSGALRPERAVPGFPGARVLEHRPNPPAPAAVLAALRSAAAEDRSKLLLRKFPPVAAKLMELSVEFAPRLEATCAGLLDAAFLAEDHAVVARLLARVNESPTRGGRFGDWLRRELLTPWRMLSLVERLRHDVPLDLASLEAWLKALGAAAIPQLLNAVDALEAGRAQEVLCRTLASLLAADLSPIVQRLEATPPRNVAAMAFVLEATGSPERSRLFGKLLARRDLPFTLQLMTGRARARSPETLIPLEAALGDRAPEVRLHALSLLGELESPAAARLVWTHVEAPAFEKRPDAERAAFWAVVAACCDTHILEQVAERFEEKATLLTRAKLTAARLPIVEGLASSHTEEARVLLERVGHDRAQPDEVSAAARAALQRRASPANTTRLSRDERTRLRRLVALDLCALVRATTVTDLSAGALDAALGRLTEALRVLATNDGRLELTVGDEQLAANGTPLALTYAGVDVGLEVAQALAAHDVRAFAVDGPVPVSETKACLLQLCDPDNTTERAPHVRLTTFSGRLLEPLAEPGRPPDPRLVAAQAYGAAATFVRAQQAALLDGRLPAVQEADALLHGWVRAYLSGATGLLALQPAQAGDDAFAVHAVNTACIGMAFATDLRLAWTSVREVAELSLFCTLVETGLAPERCAPPGAAASDEVRLRLSTLFLSQLEPNRRAVALAVAAIDAGLDAPKAPGRGSGIVATIVALAEAWDSLAVKAGLGHGPALEQLRARFAHRFNPDLLAIFSRWAVGQLPGAPPTLSAGPR